MIGRLGLAIFAVALTIGGGSASYAQDKAKAADAPKPFTKDEIAQGKKEAPAIVAASNLPCTVSDAGYIGKSSKSSVYEVACKEGLGYILLSGGSDPTKSYDCLHTLDSPSLKGRLPVNADPKQGLTPMLAAANLGGCAIKDARYIGGNATEDFYEAACQDGAGYVLQATVPHTNAAPKVLPCAQTLGNQTLECKLTSRAQSVATIAALAAKSGKPCQVSDGRFMGVSPTDNSAFYEVACGEKAGFVVETDSAGAFKMAIDCANANGIAGGCTMTDTTKAESAEAGHYTSAAKAGGFNCDVAKYRFIGMVDQPSRSEVVELACSNRPDGTVALFPIKDGLKPVFIDCILSAQFGDNAACKLTNPAPIYPKYTQALASRGRTTCTVSGARYLGHSSSGSNFVETACADGNPGWVMELDQAGAIKTLLSCGQASQVGVACKLPTNIKH